MSTRMTVEEWRQTQAQGQRKRPVRKTAQLLPLKYEAGPPKQLTLPFRIESRANFRGHTRSRGHRKAIRELRNQTCFFLQAMVKKPELPCTILLVRIAPRKLDPHDNLPGSFKNCVDGICDWLEIDDKVGCPVTWKYNQESAGTPHTYGCRIEIRK